MQINHIYAIQIAHVGHTYEMDSLSDVLHTIIDELHELDVDPHNYLYAVYDKVFGKGEVIDLDPLVSNLPDSLF